VREIHRGPQRGEQVNEKGVARDHRGQVRMQKEINQLWGTLGKHRGRDELGHPTKQWVLISQETFDWTQPKIEWHGGQCHLESWIYVCI